MQDEDDIIDALEAIDARVKTLEEGLKTLRRLVRKLDEFDELEDDDLEALR